MIMLTEGLRDEAVGSGLGSRSAADEEVHLRSTRAVTESNGACERDEVAGSHVVFGDERLLKLDDFVQTDVGVKGGLDIVEDHDGPVGASTAGKYHKSEVIVVRRR